MGVYVVGLLCSVVHTYSLSTQEAVSGGLVYLMA